MGTEHLHTRKVGFFTCFPVLRTPEGLMAEPGMGRVLNVLHSIYPDMRLAAPEAPEPDFRYSERLTVPEPRFIPMPYMPTFAVGVKHIGTCRSAMRALEADREVVVVQLAFQAPQALLRPRTPRLYHLVGDVREMAGKSTRYVGVRGVAARSYARLVDGIQRHLVRGPHARLVANGEVLFARYGARGRAVVSATLSEAEIDSVHRERPPGPPYRVLFVGYLRHEKGLDVLTSAVELLRGDGMPLELEIVGPGTPEQLGPQVAAGIRALERDGVARLTGRLRYGHDLFQRFADADVLALPSRTEGTPRVLVEARAFGCPVVASRVGGVPTSVRDGVDGRLVPPDDPVVLAAAIREVLTDDGVREGLIGAGRDGARERTVEAYARAMADEIEMLMGDRSARLPSTAPI